MNCLKCAHCHFDSLDYGEYCDLGKWVIEDFNNQEDYDKVILEGCEDYEVLGQTPKTVIRN